MTSRKVLTIFLASPSDLQEERGIIQRNVQRFNTSVAPRVGWFIELLGWEETTPGYSRPQEKINEDVDKCNLFIGLLWHRWGQPTGTYSSGFEEEFERAVERRVKTKEPEVWLFFKRIDQERLADPGEQLQRVIAFRHKLIEGKQVLFQEFLDAHDWENKSYDNLLKYVLELQLKGDSMSVSSSSPVQDAVPQLQPKVRTDVGEASQQISEVLGSFVTAALV